MSWTIVIPGQPPSWNHAYRVTRRFRMNRAGEAIPYMGIGKQEAAREWQEAAGHIIGVARPSGWKWDGGPLRLAYRFYLERPADCDNLMKLLNDAIAAKIGVDDMFFLPCVMTKATVPAAEARVEVEVVSEDDQHLAMIEALAERPDELP